MSSLRRLILILLLAAGAACGAEPEPTPTGTTGTSSPTSTETTASPTAGRPAPGSPGPTSSPTDCPPVTGGGATSVKLREVRVGTHPGYDRITFEFTPDGPAPPNTLPQYSITREQAITQDGSGFPVEVEGDALYSLVMQGASGVDLRGEQPVETYTGPKEFKPGFPALVELQHAGDFENVLSWGIGLTAPRCMEVTQLNDPLRLVLDIPHS